MTLIPDLMGLGMAPGLASKVGNPLPPTLAGVGTSQTGAAALSVSVTYLTTGSGQTAFTLPKTAVLGKEFYIYNTSATTALLFPPLGGATLNGSSSASMGIAQNKGAICMLVTNGTNGAAPQWCSILSN